MITNKQLFALTLIVGLVAVIGAAQLAGLFFREEQKLQPNEIIIAGLKIALTDNVSTIESIRSVPYDGKIAEYLFSKPVDIIVILSNPSCEKYQECGHMAIAALEISQRILYAYRLLGYEPLDPVGGNNSATIYMRDSALVTGNPRVIRIIITVPSENKETEVSAFTSPSNPNEIRIFVKGDTGLNLRKAADKLTLIALRNYKSYLAFSV